MVDAGCWMQDAGGGMLMLDAGYKLKVGSGDLELGIGN